MPESASVFISYAWGPEEPPKSGRRPLQKRAQKIAAALRAHALGGVWLDTEKMGAAATGNGLSTAMTQGIEASDVVIVCLSAAYAASENCKAEFMFAHNKGKKLLYANVGEPSWDPKSLSGEGAWLLLQLGDRLWADCRSDAAFAGPGGIALLTKSG